MFAPEAKVIGMYVTLTTEKTQLVPLLGPRPPSVTSLCFQSQEISCERVLEKKVTEWKVDFPLSANSSQIVVVNSKTAIVSPTRYCNFLTFKIEDSYPHTSSALAWPTSFCYPFAREYKKYNRPNPCCSAMKRANKRLTVNQFHHQDPSRWAQQKLSDAKICLYDTLTSGSFWWCHCSS